MLFFRVFLRTLGFLTAVLTFIIIVNLLLYSTKSIQKNHFVMIEGNENSKNIIAKINLNGPIFNNSKGNFGENFYDYINPANIRTYLNELKNLDIKVLLININSPGGTVSATAELEKILSDFKKESKVKVYFFTKEILASGGYWVATSADKIFASYGSVIGSIGVSGPSWFFYDTPISLSSGVLGQSIETKGGIKVYNQNAGKSKDLFNPYRRPEDKEIKHLQEIVEEIYSDFITKVSRNRNVDISFVKNTVGALIYSSDQAKKNYLIDDVLDYETLIEYIIEENNFSDYNIYENKQNYSLIASLFSKYNYNDNLINKICRNFETSFNVISPLFLENC